METSQELIFFLSFGAMGFIAFLLAGIGEFVFLKRSGWIDSAKIAKYVAGSNILGAGICFGFLIGSTGVFLVLVTATLGGVWWLTLLSIAAGLIAVVGLPLLMIVARQLVRRLCGIETESITWRYATLLALIDCVAVFVVIAVVMMILSVLGGLNIAA